MPGESAVKLGYVSVAGRGRIDLLLADVVERLKASRLAIAGTVQTNIERDDRPKCDMDLRLLPTGWWCASASTAAQARGCRLDAEHGTVRELGGRRWTDRTAGREQIRQAGGRGPGPDGGDRRHAGRGLPALVGVNGRNLPPSSILPGASRRNSCRMRSHCRLVPRRTAGPGCITPCI